MPDLALLRLRIRLWWANRQMRRVAAAYVRATNRATRAVEDFARAYREATDADD